MRTSTRLGYDSPMSEGPAKPHWFRFSLRTMLLLAMLVGACLAFARAVDDSPTWPLAGGVLFWCCLVLVMLRARRRRAGNIAENLRLD
jgi:hypothetical protein